MISNTKEPDRSTETSPANCAILIIDDSETDRYTYRRYLEAADLVGCQIWECESAELALEFCEHTRPNLILLDYLMPDLDGLQFLQELAERVKIVPPTIMLTGQGNEQVAVEAMKHGAIDYLVKAQLTPLKLVNAVTSALSVQKLQAQIDRQYQQQKLLGTIVVKIGQSVELSELLQTTVQGCLELLDADRVAIYQLEPDLSGIIVSEAVLPQWSSSIGQQIEEDCFDERTFHPMSKYLDGGNFVVTDIDSADLSPCYVAMLKQFQVKSLIVVPILFRAVFPLLSEPIVWGLLIVHQCRAARMWQTDEQNLLQELSIQMAIAIRQAELVSDLHVTIDRQQEVELQLRDRVLEIEQTNLRLSVVTNLLEKRNQELDEFACIASHDLQAPLRGIANLTDWLSKDLAGTLPAENQQQIDLIQQRVSQMNTLINGLLQYARVGRENANITNVNLNRILTEVVETIDPPATFKINFPANPINLRTQSLLLKQVFANLIGNAVKYHDRLDGKIEIVATERKHSWQFSVIDNGPGIAPEHHHKIFGIFQTLKGNDDNKGSGVGLAIVQKLVESRGGSVWVDSDLGKGSTFSFTWFDTP
jgi:signal transduction histidine kinase/ActR/RegA family two-component response regulator